MKPTAQPSLTDVAAAQLVQTHQTGVWRYLRALGCTQAVADDLTQECFLHVLRRPFQEFSHSATAAYLRKTALNLWIDWSTREGRMTVTDDIEKLDVNWTDWAGDDNAEELLATLRECLQKLTDRARMALEMRFRDDASRDQIAVALQMSGDGAKNLMQRAKQQLRDCIVEKLT